MSSDRGGQAGNTNAIKAKPWADSLRRALARHSDREQRDALDKIADDLIIKALGGDVEARMELANRLDGRPVQRTELSGPDGDALAFQDSTDVKRKLLAGIAAAVTQPDSSDAQRP